MCNGKDVDRRQAKVDNFVTRRIVNETVIVPVRGDVGDLDAIYTLNEPGGRIWQLIDKTRSVREIVDMIRAEYEVSAEEAERDISELLASLESAGLVQAIPAEGEE